MRQGPPTPEPGPKILSFQEFIRPNSSGMPKYNNFFVHFVTSGWVAEIYREKKYYKRFESEHRDMAISLCKKIQKRDKSLGLLSFKPFEKDLYEAYKIMRSYGVSDEDLFR